MTFVFRRIDLSFLSELVGGQAVKSKEAQDSFLIVKNSLLQAQELHVLKFAD